MKRFILFIFLVVLSTLAYCQNNGAKRLFLKDGTVINGDIQIEPDGSYKVKTSNGDIFYFFPSEVEQRGEEKVKTEKQLPQNDIIIGEKIERHGNMLRFVDTKTPLSKNDFYRLEGWEKYESIRKRGKIGRGLLYGGLGGIALGAGLIILEVETNTNVVGYIGSVLVFSGIGASITGAVFTIKSNKRLNRMEDSYVRSAGYSLNFGVQQYGVGFAFRF